MYIIAGEFKGRKLAAPKGLHTRPTSNKMRESLFNICQNFIRETHFLDLFAGSGLMGLEAISRGAMHATFVESHAAALDTIKNNIETLHIQTRTTILKMPFPRCVPNLKSYDIIFADPPYRDINPVFLQSLYDALRTILKPEGHLFLETGPIKEDIACDFLEQKSRRFVGKSLLWHFTRIAS